MRFRKSDFDKEYKYASKVIRQANEGLPNKVQMNPNYEIHVIEGASYISLRISYLDGNDRPQVYSIAM